MFINDNYKKYCRLDLVELYTHTRARIRVQVSNECKNLGLSKDIF
jgi:hypothetical protein